MTSLEFIKSDIDIQFDGFTNNTCLHISELATLLKEFALLKCSEQREICADELYEHHDVWRVGSKNQILNAESPEM